jgi:hypothetical protein
MSSDLIAILDNPLTLFVDVHLSSFTPGTPEHKLLSVFAYGNWSDYVKLAPSLPAELRLDPAGNAVKKLKKLTLLSIFSTAENVFPFSRLEKELQIDNHVDLEKLIIDLLGLDYLEAKINEQEKTVVVTRAAARCVKNEAADILAVVGKIKDIREGIKRALDISNPGD